MTRVLVTGATGFVGRRLCADLVRRGVAVSAATRNPRLLHDVHGVDLRAVAGLGAGTDWSGALRGVDAVVHLAARVHVMDDRAADPLAEFRRINAEGTRRLAEDAAAAGARRFVLLSTIKVNGEHTGDTPFADETPPMPEDPYARSKWEAERALAAVAAATGMEAVVLRPPLVYGPGVKGNFLSLLKLCRKAPPLPLASVRNARSLIFVGNLTAAIAACLEKPAAAGRTYLVRDGEDLSTPDLIRRLAAALDRPARLFPCPPAVLRAAAALAGRSAAAARLLDSLRVDDGKIRRELNWTPPHGVDQGLTETAAWFLSRARFRTGTEERHR
ncbi:MAG: NAD-dependent epimerase/dehydratase family protein [Hyphomicrobiales bacterium]|nr:NAD-dependent epimerase/dehydratase family protein [Hyphomicrobiales bacterium]MCP5370509.1 NAD-dependent epimerase/dehydratase family protein [Hyphomicrobiales bacterium]